MPFLAPAIAAWIALAVGVLAYYFLRLAPIDRRRSSDSDVRRPTYQTPSAAGPSLSILPMTTQRVLPTYDLAAYPTDRWS